MIRRPPHSCEPVSGKRTSLLLSLLALVLSSVSIAAAADAPSSNVRPISERVQIDGVLTEPAWHVTPSIQEFVQAEPRSGEAPSEKKSVWLAYTRDALFVAVKCSDSRPNSIVATQMSRDAELRDNDNIEIVLDTYNDHRNAYYFATNPAGALVDGRITENGEPALNWDGIWNVRTQIAPDGWTAEFEIPFKTLGFSPAISGWGFNMSRQIARLRETSRWASPSFDVRISQAARAGDITGLEGLSQGVGLDVKPYGLIGADRDIYRADRVKSNVDGGLDFFYRITSNLVSSTTFNTDFAETEVDTRQVSLSRFPLFFPEKRSFFLEDAGVFEFGSIGRGGRGPGHGSDFLPFFSRRIGLLEGMEAPIRAGEKITGKIGRFDVGLLDVQTGDVSMEGGQVVKGRNLAVGRVKANFGSQSYIGGMFTNGDPTGFTNNQVAGVDLNLSTSNFLNRGKNMGLMVFGSHARTSGVNSRNNAYGATLSYPNDFLDAQYSFTEIGENYNAALGFIPRRGVRINSATMEFGPRPRFWGLRQVSFDFNYKNYYNIRHGASESTEFGISPGQFRFNSGEMAFYEFARKQERLFEPWEIREGIIIAPGNYWTNEHMVVLETSQSRPVSFDVRASTGDFFTGTMKSISGGISWRNGRRLSTAFSWERNWVRFPNGKFTTSLPMYRLDYSFTPFITLASFVQYDTDSRNIGLQSRLRWILRPGNEFFIVLNHAWQENQFDRFESAQTRFRAKLNYTFRF